ncbi:MAG: nicotinate phosphoribosyltransferase [bacterium]
MDETFGEVTSEGLALFTDLYELTMMEGYFKEDHNPEAVFELFVRTLPEKRNYLIAAGLQQAIAYLDNINFTDDALEYLRTQGFEDEFLSYLESFEFTGDLRAVPEGVPVFPNEPILEVKAPIIQAQLFETLLINQISFQTLIATKAARMKDVIERHGDDQTLVDFGTRRAHGTDAGIKAARACYIGGFNGTSNVTAGEQFDLPIFGTMAHSWVESFPTERAAFEAFADLHRDDTILLVDTYDTLNGTRTAKRLVEDKDYSIRGIRIDSGDLIELSKSVNEIAPDMGVFVSSGVDEYFLKEFLTDGGVASGFGIGTSLVTSSDAPKLEAVYKLMAVERNGELDPVMKLSSGKVTYPGRKSIKRLSEDGTFQKDILTLKDADDPGDDLLEQVFHNGTLTYDSVSLDEKRRRCITQTDQLPADLRTLETDSSYPVEISEELSALQQKTEDTIHDRVQGPVN